MMSELSGQSTLELWFGGGGRTVNGEDLQRLLLDGLPEDRAEIVATLDAAGAVSGYNVTLRFDTADLATEAAFRLRDLFLEMGVEFHVS